MLRLWDISIYVRLLVGNKSIWYGYDLEKKSRWFVVRTFILKTSIIDDWLVVWLGYFQQWVRFIFLALCFLHIYKFYWNNCEKCVIWKTHKIFQLEFVAICLIYVKRS